MAAPSWITDPYTSITGEFAAANATSFVSAIGFDPSQYPQDLLSLPTGTHLPNTNPFQVQMLKTMMTAGGRTQLFQNPFTTDLASVRTRLNAIIVTPGADGGPSPLIPAAQDMLDTLTHFEFHTNLLSGAVVPGNDADAQHPTLEKALAVGSSLSSLSAIVDGTSSNNAAHLSLFSSFFEGKNHMSSLKDLLAQPDSQISGDAILGLSQNLINTTSNDVANYTVGLRKLRATSIANIVFGAKNKQIESVLFKDITTPYAQDLFTNADAYTASLKVGPPTKSGTPAVGGQYSDIKELILYNGLFESIPMTWDLWQTLQKNYPATDAGILNSAILAASVVVKDSASLQAFFSTAASKNQFLHQIWFDILTRDTTTPTIWTGSADVFYDGWIRFGSLSKLMVAVPTSATIFPENDMKLTIFDSTAVPNRLATQDELDAIKFAMKTRTFSPFTLRATFLIFGQHYTFSQWLATVTAIPKVVPPPPSSVVPTVTAEDLTQGTPVNQNAVLLPSSGRRVNFFLDSGQNFRNTPGNAVWTIPVAADFKGTIRIGLVQTPDTHTLPATMTVLGKTYALVTDGTVLGTIRYGAAAGPGELAGTKRLLDVQIGCKPDTGVAFQFHVYPDDGNAYWAKHPNGT